MGIFLFALFVRQKAGVIKEDAWDSGGLGFAGTNDIMGAKHEKKRQARARPSLLLIMTTIRLSHNVTV